MGKFFAESAIVNEEMAKAVVSFFPTGLKNSPSILYRLSKDGKLGSDFHRMSDNQGPTLTLIKDVNGNVFGGYTAANWGSTGAGKYIEDKSGFLFTLKNPHGIPPTKYPLLPNKTAYAIYSYPNYGPVFGDGYDILIDSNHMNASYVNFPGSYTDMTGKGKATFTGVFTINSSNVFTPEEIEVWKIF